MAGCVDMNKERADSKKRFHKLRAPIIAVIGALLIAGVGVTAWLIRPQGVMNRAREALADTGSVRVNGITVSGVNGWLIEPKETGARTSVIFYPGARVPVEAYAPHARRVAAKGYEVYLVNMPLNLAILGWKKAGKIISSQSDARNWVMAGHSMGGAMAARFVSKTSYPIEGLVLWASYPPGGAKFDSGLAVLSITGDRDNIIDRDKIRMSRSQLPESARFVEIEGGNHSQFGWYGFQSGDGRATISRNQQMEIVANLTVDFLREL